MLDYHHLHTGLTTIEARPHRLCILLLLYKPCPVHLQQTMSTIGLQIADQMADKIAFENITDTLAVNRQYNKYSNKHKIMIAEVE